MYRKTVQRMLLILSLSLTGFAQEMPQIDPEALKLMESFQKQNANIPAELLALMPAGLELTNKHWMVEPTSKMLLNLSLESNTYTKLENSENYYLVIKISMNAYNVNSFLGKTMADQTLAMQRQEAAQEWLQEHPAGVKEWLQHFEPEKIQLPKGVLYTQKIHAQKHGDGEGDVAARTTYVGFLYLDVPGGFLTAKIGEVPNTKAGIEKWLQQIAAAAGKLNIDSYFK